MYVPKYHPGLNTIQYNQTAFIQFNFTHFSNWHRWHYTLHVILYQSLNSKSKSARRITEEKPTNKVIFFFFVFTLRLTNNTWHSTWHVHSKYKICWYVLYRYHIWNSNGNYSNRIQQKEIHRFLLRLTWCGYSKCFLINCNGKRKFQRKKKKNKKLNHKSDGLFMRYLGIEKQRRKIIIIYIKICLVYLMKVIICVACHMLINCCTL